MSNRILDYPEATAITSDDYILLDNEGSGAKCIKASALNINMDNYTIKEARGAIASFNDGEDLPLAFMGAYITAIQEGSGDPSPSNVRPILGFSGVEVVVSPLNISQLYNGQVYGDGSWVSSNMRLTNVTETQDNSYFLKAGTYTLDYDKLNSNAPNLLQCSALTKDGNYTIIDNFANEWNSLPFTFTLTQDSYLYFTIRKDADTNLNPSDYRVKILGNTYSLTFTDGSNPLTVYGGYVDLVSGVMTVTYAKIALADIPKSKYSTYQYGIRTISSFFDSIPNSGLLTGMSNTFVLSDSGESYNVDKCSIVFSGGSSKTSILISTQASGLSADASVTEINEWLRSIDAYIVYPLATPLTYQLSKQQIRSLVGDNNIFADTGDSVVDYRKLWVKPEM